MYRLTSLRITGTLPTLVMEILLNLVPPYTAAQTGEGIALRLHFAGKWKDAKNGDS